MKATPDPLHLAHLAWQRARRRGDHAAETMALATVDADGRPAVRTVLIKGIDAQGFSFVTRSRSPKVQHLQAQPIVELCINWMSLRLQVRCRGQIHPMPDELVAQLWQHRPRDAKLLYHLRYAQSQIIPSLQYLRDRLRQSRDKWLGVADIPRSPLYIGFIIEPQWIEFLEHNAIRLNHRTRYTRKGTEWTTACLAP